MPRPDLLHRLTQRHAERAQQHLLRRLRAVDTAQGPWIEVGGRQLLSFASNDYLGLMQHPALRTALIDCAQREGVGAGAAHLLGGHRREHRALEDALADWLQRPRALLFSTGYMANLGVLGALLGKGDLCVQDKLNHACLLDGAQLAGCELKRYVHADVASAERQLQSRPKSAALLASDGVFSMDGDVAPLAALSALCREQSATLLIDDAHGLGVLGPEGRGSVAESALGIDEVPALMATLGKALGVAGAFIAGSEALVEGLVQFARTYVYTTAMPPALAMAALAAVRVARHESWRRDQLQILIRHFRSGAQERGIEIGASRTPIQPVLLGPSKVALAVANHLERNGFYVPAIRPPTVAANTARLRVTLSAAHTERDVERLLDTLARAIGKVRSKPSDPSAPGRTIRVRKH